MNRKILTATVSATVIYLAMVVAWHAYAPQRNFAMQLPGADNRPPETARRANEVRIGEFFMRYEDEGSSLTGRWACFRGEDYSNIVRTGVDFSPLRDSFPVLWSVDTGEGHAAPVINRGMVYFLDYDEALSSDMLRCLSLETGKEQWRRWYRVPVKRNHGFSRTAPYVSDDFIVTIGPQGHVMCCDTRTGSLLWAKDMQEEFKTEVPFWYTGQCPRVEDGALVVAPAGKDVLLAGIDCRTGEVVWETPNSVGFKMSHSSVTPMTLHGKKFYVYAGIGGVCGVSAEKESLGRLVWSQTKWQPSVIAPSPLQVSAGSIFLVAGYGSGGGMLRVENSGGRWTATVTEQYKASEGLSSEQQTPVLYKDMIITVIPKDGGSLRGKLVAYSPSDLHTPLWSSGAEERFGLGPYMVINDRLLAFKDDGELFVYNISSGMRLEKRQRILEGEDAWGPMAYADGRLLVRDARHVVCLNTGRDV